MPITMLPTYRTGDGRTHDDLDNAMNHERHLLLCHAIFADGQAPMGSIDAIADLVKRNFPQIKAVMEIDLHREMLDDATKRIEKPKVELPKVAEDEIEKELAGVGERWAYDVNGDDLFVGATVRPADKRFAKNAPRAVTAINTDGTVQIAGDDSWRPGKLFALATADGAAT